MSYPKWLSKPEVLIGTPTYLDGQPKTPVSPEEKPVEKEPIKGDVKTMQVSQEGLDLIVHFEGIKLTAYLDAVNVPTIGIGRIKGVTREDVKNGRTITREEAFGFLREDLEDESVHYIRSWIKVPMSQPQFDATASFVFNRGAGRFRGKIVGLLNAGDYAGAGETLLEYDWAGKPPKVLEGLARRRYAERELFNGGDWRKFDSIYKFREFRKGARGE